MTEHVDVVIVGAGISGISAAWHLQQRSPGKDYAILEARDGLGGTWDLFKYPGIRSDSDMFTLGFRFKPWESAKAIADGGSILEYLKETAAENGIDRHMRFGHRVTSVDWSDEDARWTLHIDRGGEQQTMTCSFLLACSGYYDYGHGYTPEFEGSEDFGGPIIHPQHWPTDLDYAGKKIVVIGSGATAVTLIPALVRGGAEHVTMLQRTPTYVGSLPDVDPVAVRANRLLPTRLAHVVNRWKAIAFSTAQYQLSQRFPSYMRKTLLTMASRRLPEGFDVERHFGPDYKPWDQRLCLAPNGDLFKTIRSGKADVVTDTTKRFTETGILLDSGEHLDADIIITATGLNVQFFGGATVSRNGRPVDLADSIAYKGMMLSGIPNTVFTFGYTNASWTLKADLTSEYICRLLNYMDSHGYRVVEPAEPGDRVERRPFVELSSGYIKRSIDSLPKSGSETPWRLKQNYFVDLRIIRQGRVDDGTLKFDAAPAALAV